VNGSYILVVLSDPFGWGWDLFGTAQVSWRPLIPEYLGYLQMGLLGIGLFYALRRGFFVGKQLFASWQAALWALVPVGGFCTAVVLAFLIFFLG
jgi:hypothetical protein